MSEEIPIAEYMNETEETPETAAPKVDATVQTLLNECRRLTAEKDEALRQVKVVEAEKETLLEKNNTLADKLIRHHLDPDDLTTKVDPEELQEYTRCIFGGDRTFTKEYTLHGNNKIVMAALTDKEGRIASAVVTAAIEASEKEKITNAEATIRIFKLRMLWHVRGVNPDTDNGETYVFPDITTLEEAEKEFDKRFGEKTDAFIGILVRVVKQHTDVLLLLSNAIFDENFYKGAGLR